MVTTSSEDPFGVLSSTLPMLASARFVKIDRRAAAAMAERIARRLEQGLEAVGEHFGAGSSLADDVQLIFLEDVVNFCFWAERDRPKWSVEYPAGTAPLDGWYALMACFKRALTEGVPILDARFLSELSAEQAERLFRSSNGTQIPLLAERRDNLREAGRVLIEKYEGQFLNVLERTEFDAVRLVPLVCEELPSFRDITFLEGREVRLLKRAQILAHDLSLLSGSYPEFALKNTPCLTAMADYKLPQILRYFDVLQYAPELAVRVDRYELLPAGSREEVEIRAATVWAVEEIRQSLPQSTAADIDMALWFMSQNVPQMKPYHRTLTIYY